MFGCSVTRARDIDENKNYVSLLNKELNQYANFVNLAVPGAGLHYVLQEFYEYKSYVDICIIQVPSFDRQPWPLFQYNKAKNIQLVK